jgi:hypothetical protein
MKTGRGNRLPFSGHLILENSTNISPPDKWHLNNLLIPSFSSPED